jgi:hypothetical protein
LASRKQPNTPKGKGLNIIVDKVFLMAHSSGDEGFVDAVIDFLVGVWFLFSEMASLLRRFSMSVEGDLRFHAALASNRISLLAKNLEDGLSHLGADFLKILSFESLRREYGTYMMEILERMAGFLSAFSGRLKAAEVIDVGEEIREFEDAIMMAINAFSRIREMLSEHHHDKRAVLLTFLLNDLISDLRLIGVRLQQAKSQLRMP